MKASNKTYTSIRLAFWTGLLLAGLGCQTKSALELQPVGPPWFRASLGPVAPHATGFLLVYSATKPRREAGRTYHPHTSYLICKANGSHFRWIANSLEAADQTPALVALPAGSYVIQARDQDHGRIRVPVLVEPWRTTTVYLDGKSTPSLEMLAATNSVALPDGRRIGWRADWPEPTAAK